uniref:Uncharacterized protein n=1 Tax=Marseillevirus LCMAC103 TaxID=2506604 RepID=A0A481YTP7_9VIRU|nr:MAG: hypothetical protein LCMAC103_00220 [Marseillevirus LCMAC103]
MRPRVVDPDPAIVSASVSISSREAQPFLLRTDTFETIADTWASIQAAEANFPRELRGALDDRVTRDPGAVVKEFLPIKFSAFVDRLVVVEEPGYDLFGLCQLEPLIELCRPHDMTYEECERAMQTGRPPKRCLCPECLVLRAALKKKTLKGSLPRCGDVVRAFDVPTEVGSVTLQIDGDAVWSRSPDASGRIQLAADEVIPLAALALCQVALEPPCEFTAEYLDLLPSVRSKLYEMDLGVYQKYFDKSWRNRADEATRPAAETSPGCHLCRRGHKCSPNRSA